MPTPPAPAEPAVKESSEKAGKSEQAAVKEGAAAEGATSTGGGKQASGTASPVKEAKKEKKEPAKAPAEEEEEAGEEEEAPAAAEEEDEEIRARKEHFSTTVEAGPRKRKSVQTLEVQDFKEKKAIEIKVGGAGCVEDGGLGDGGGGGGAGQLLHSLVLVELGCCMECVLDTLSPAVVWCGSIRRARARCWGSWSRWWRPSRPPAPRTPSSSPSTRLCSASQPRPQRYGRASLASEEGPERGCDRT